MPVGHMFGAQSQGHDSYFQNPHFKKASYGAACSLTTVEMETNGFLGPAGHRGCPIWQVLYQQETVCPETT